MSDAQKRQELADRLLALNLPELIDVLRRVLPAHNEDEERNGLTHRLVLTEAIRYHGPWPEGSDDPRTMLEVVAWPDAFYDGAGGPVPGLHQSSSCEVCGVEITCTVKQVFCAVCDERNYLS